MPEAKELAEFVKPEFEKLGLKVHIISTASHEGLKELNWALADLVTNMRAEVAKREQAEEEARVVIKPLEERAIAVAVTTKAATRSTSPWNARRTATAKSGTRCSAPSRNAGSCRPTSIMTRPSATCRPSGQAGRRRRAATQRAPSRATKVRIGRGDRAVEFDWDPTIAAGAEMLDGTQLGARGVDLRLQESDVVRSVVPTRNAVASTTR